jgi:hypothetical protein
MGGKKKFVRISTEMATVSGVWRMEEIKAKCFSHVSCLAQKLNPESQKYETTST